MIFQAAELAGVYLIEPERLSDERGFFARTWCQHEFEAHGLEARLAQCSLSFNLNRGTLRGLHYQIEPHTETKLIRCTQGRLYDVAVDLRPASPTYLRWLAIELSADNRRMVYLPPGLAHGFQTLGDHTEVFYQISEFYHPESARGVRWNDPAFNIHWPLPNPILSEKDRTYPDYVTL